MSCCRAIRCAIFTTVIEFCQSEVLGFSFSRPAVQGKSAQGRYDEAGIEGAGNRGDYAELALNGKELSGGWHVIVVDREDDSLVRVAPRVMLWQGARLAEVLKAT